MIKLYVVRITKASAAAVWYANKIGEEFEVKIVGCNNPSWNSVYLFETTRSMGIIPAVQNITGKDIPVPGHIHPLDAEIISEHIYNPNNVVSTN